VTVSEKDRHELHERATAVLGERGGEVLMELLPRSGWSELVTKTDLQLQLQALRSDMAAVLQEAIGEVRRDMNRQTWIFAGSVLTAAGVLGGLLH